MHYEMYFHTVLDVVYVDIAFLQIQSKLDKLDLRQIWNDLQFRTEQ
jgi:hypothetical protein